MINKMGRVLIIAGSDSGGGAGIQADIKTVTMMGGYAATAITCVTVQNTLGVTDVHAVPADVVYNQVRAVLDDIGADVIKTGMLYNSAIIKASFQAIEDSGFTGPVIVDPVMVATSGDPLLKQEAVNLYRTNVLTRATIMTPNIPELSVLADMDINTIEDVKQAADILGHQGLNAVLAKGGHLLSTGDQIRNYYQDRDQAFDFTVPRIPSRNTHGTGCTMASALAAALAERIARGEGKTIDMQAACQLAAKFVQQAIKQAPDFGAGAGPMGHAQVNLRVDI